MVKCREAAECGFSRGTQRNEALPWELFVGAFSYVTKRKENNFPNKI